MNDLRKIGSRLQERYRVPDSLGVKSAPESSPEFLEFIEQTDVLIESLLLESYSHSGYSNPWQRALLATYYALRCLLPDRIRERLQRRYLLQRTESFPAWPVDFTADVLLENQLARLMNETGVDSVPFIWFWPNECKACAIVTHDVETERGTGFCHDLIDLDVSFGFRASFQIVPEERYDFPPTLLDEIRKSGFEIAVHDLNHDGRLYLNHKTFSRRIGIVNRYGKEFAANGFRAGVMYRNQRWFDELEFEFDMSVPNNAKFEPQGGGCCSVMPYFIGHLLELPLTTAQDYTLFHILNDFSPDIWLEQVDAIYQKHGLISVLTHPDYIMEPKALAAYKLLLGRLTELRENGDLWVATPCELNQWWRQRSRLKLERKQNGEWRIVGDDASRASIARAVLSNGTISYELNGREVLPAPMR